MVAFNNDPPPKECCCGCCCEPVDVQLTSTILEYEVDGVKHVDITRYAKAQDLNEVYCIPYDSPPAPPQG